MVERNGVNEGFEQYDMGSLILREGYRRHVMMDRKTKVCWSMDSGLTFSIDVQSGNTSI